MKELIKLFPFNLAYAVTENTEKALQLNQINLVKELDTLTEDEKHVLLSRFKNKQTYEEIGNSIDRSRERVRQICKMGLRKLRSPLRMGQFDTVTVAEYNNTLTELKALKEKNNYLLFKYDELANSVANIPNNYKPESIIAQYETTIDRLGLSNRAHNVLFRARIRTLGDLLEFRVSELLNIRNLGVNTFNEIKQVVESYGC